MIYIFSAFMIWIGMRGLQLHILQFKLIDATSTFLKTKIPNDMEFVEWFAYMDSAYDYINKVELYDVVFSLKPITVEAWYGKDYAKFIKKYY